MPPCGPRTSILQAEIGRLAEAGKVAAIEIREVERNGPGRPPSPFYYIALMLGAAPKSAGRWRYLTTRREVFEPRHLHHIEVANRILREVAPEISATLVRASRLPPRAVPE